MNYHRLLSLAFLTCFCVAISGCGTPTAEKFPTKEKKLAEKREMIFNKTTQDIEEFTGADEETDLAVKKGTNPIAAYAGGVRYAIGTTAKLGVTRALQLFNAAEGRYPKDHEEFMTKVIKANGIQLPVLPGKRRYQYDVENHELIIVEPAEK